MPPAWKHLYAPYSALELKNLMFKFEIQCLKLEFGLKSQDFEEYKGFEVWFCVLMYLMMPQMILNQIINLEPQEPTKTMSKNLQIPPPTQPSILTVH